MRAPKVYVVSVLITICTLLAAGYPQASNAHPGLEVNNNQDAGQKPSNAGGAVTTNTIPGAANPGQATPSKTSNGPSPVQPATPANTPADLNSSVATVAAPYPTTIPQSALFEFLFNNISVLNKVADSDDKAGNHISAARWRMHDARGAGLNDSEGQILQEITLDCLRALKQQDAKFQASAEKFRAQLAPDAPVLIPSDLAQMDEDRKTIISNHIERLREALGDASFNKLDTYVHSSFHAEVIAPKPATSSTTIIEKSPQESR